MTGYEVKSQSEMFTRNKILISASHNKKKQLWPFFSQRLLWKVQCDLVWAFVRLEAPDESPFLERRWTGWGWVAGRCANKEETTCQRQVKASPCEAPHTASYRTQRPFYVFKEWMEGMWRSLYSHNTMSVRFGFIILTLRETENVSDTYWINCIVNCSPKRKEQAGYSLGLLYPAITESKNWPIIIESIGKLGISRNGP